ncbi:MAG: O-antigen polymerase [Caulobacter sp.]|nr:O-antigen polymerase [Caulobacter sp.]
MGRAPWSDVAPDQAQHRPADLFTIGIFLLSVGSLLIYTQGWVMPLFGDKVDPAASTLIRNLFLPAYAAGLLMFALQPGQGTKVLVRQPFLVLLMLIVAASTMWSIAPDQTSRRVIAVGCTTLSGVMLAARYRWSTLAEIVGACFLVVTVASLIVCMAVPSIGRMTELFPGAWRGLWPEKNSLGGNMALAFVSLSAAALLNKKRAWLWGGGAALALFLVLMSTSKTSLVSLLLGVAALGFVMVARRGPAHGVAASWTAVTGITLLAGFIIFASDVFFAILGKDATLTGRTKIWAAAMHQIQLRPWTGYGYGAVWDETSGWGPLAWIVKEAQFKARHAHNAWLEQWLGLGIGGLAAFGLFWLQALAMNIVAVFRDKGAYLAFPYFIVYSLMSLTESIGTVYNDLRWVLFVALAAKLTWPDRYVKD